MTSIWGLDAGGVWRVLAPSQYPAEAALHDLVEQAPQLLPLAGSPTITVLGREVRLGAGVADLLAVESSGRLVIIEVKLAGNAESRRAVVAQVLSYAAYLQGLSVDQFEFDVLGGDSVIGLVEASDQLHAVEPQAFRDGLARSLADGDFRLVFVLDSAPDELVQVVGYLELVTDRIQVDLVTVTAHEVGGARILVPQRIEPARRVAQLSAADALARHAHAVRPGSEDFRAAVADAPADQQPGLNRLTAWAEQLQQQGLVRLASYRGKAGITSLLPRLAGDDAGLVTIYCDRRHGYVQLWRSVFVRRAPTHLPRVEAALGMSIKQGTTIRQVSDELLDLLSDAYKEAADNATGR